MDNKNLLSSSLVMGFKKIRDLQNGYSGKVFHGIQNKTGQEVVVKCYNKENHWKSESVALHILKHPNIIQLVGKPFINSDNYLGEENQEVTYVLALEYAHKGDFYEKLKKKGFFSEEETKNIFIDLLLALKYAYEKHGISHRDIKLENTLEMEDGTVKLADWGLCVFNAQNKKCCCSNGTLGYMAPEILKREEYDSQKTDIWSLAVLLFSLCTGNRPYGEPKSRKKNKYDQTWKDEWLSAIIDNKLDIWWKSHLLLTKNTKNLSPELIDLIKKMFHPCPKKRISFSEIYNHIWLNTQIKERERNNSFLKEKVTFPNIIINNTKKNNSFRDKLRYFLKCC